MTLRPARITPTQQSATQRTTPHGTGYTDLRLMFADQPAIAYVPDTITEPATLVIMCHGYQDDYTWIDPAATPRYGAPTALAFVDQGWIVISHRNHGDSWGNDDAMSDVMDCYAWAAGRWPLRNLFIEGFSMGGMLTYNTVGNRLLPVTAAVTINGVVDAQRTWRTQLYGIYGGSTVAELTANMAGHDPLRDDPARWAGVPFFMTSSPNDTATPTPYHAQKFYDRAATPDLIEFRTHQGSHTQDTSFMVDDVVAWLAEAATHPGSGLWTTSGTEVRLWDTGGSPAPVTV